jgi:cell pole-organizing protein PopZ
MKIEKATWNTSADSVRLAMPLTKIDEEKRQVSGFASLDNADSHDDIVLADASAKAFSRFRGNIREMHQPIAVGRMVDFREDEYYDSKTNKFYRGIYVTVKVSKGAQDTWEKVLDGTLTGFSIGGNIIDAESQFVKDAKKSIRFIKDYELIELSLVDNPANQLANVFSIEKTADGQVMKGMVADTKTEITFYCPEDEIAKTSSQESIECPSCGNSMKDIGWFEYATDSEKAQKMAECVQKYLSSSNTQESPANNEGGVDVAEDTVEKNAVPEGQGEIPVGAGGQAQTEVESSVENTEVTEVPEPEAQETEAAADVSEVENAEDDLAKMFDNLKDELVKSVSSNIESVNSALDGVNAKFEEFSKALEKRFEELDARHGELSEKFAGLKDEIGKVEKSVSTLEGKTAFKKSGDLGGSQETVVEKTATSTWGGHFLSVESLQD